MRIKLSDRLRKSLAIAIGVVICISFMFSIYVGHVALEAERTLHAYYLVSDLLIVYVNEHSGHWPKRWNDLTQVRPSRHNPAFDWPNDLSEIQSRIHVDFSVTTAQVAVMSPDNFSALTPIGPSYGQLDDCIRDIITLARRESNHSTQ
jgi:hypothetical protein